MKFLYIKTALILGLSLVGIAAPVFAQDSATADQENTEVAETPEAYEAPADEAQAPTEEASAAAEDSVIEEVKSPWTASCEIGFNLTEGNASSRDLASACNTGTKYGILKLGATGGWNYGIARFGRPQGKFITNKNNWNASLREDVFLDDAERAYLFLIEAFNGDEFAGLEWAFVGTVGAGYSYVKSETQEHKAEFGFVIARENFTVASMPPEWRPGLVVSLLGNATLHDKAEANYKISYLPSLTDFGGDFSIESEGALVFKLADKLAFKTGITWMYDNAPNDIVALDQTGSEIAGATRLAKPHDLTWSNLLILTIL